jgi:carboxypeptidase Taq
MGHAIFEQQINPLFDGTALHVVSNMALHESQSRMLENLIGRSRSFWEVHYPKLVESFPFLKKLGVNDFYNFINQTKLSKIRIEADELTYPLHVLVRYEMEKEIFNTNIKAWELPSLWNKLYKKYLNQKVESDSEGILQDIHWSGGSFGYFPTYALGSAYSSQFYNSMSSQINIDDALKNNNYAVINEWLKNNIHQYGAFLSPKEILLKATGEEFNPNYYIDYLLNKFASLKK